jgi:hypothetical protein
VRDPVTGKLWTKFRTKGISLNARVNGESAHDNQLSNVEYIASAASLFANEESAQGFVSRTRSAQGIQCAMGERLKKIAPSSSPSSEKNTFTSHSSMFTIKSCSMDRTILRSRWNGRAYLTDSITVPYGWSAHSE